MLQKPRRSHCLSEIISERRYRNKAGFALISTLLVVILVTIIAVSFLASVGTERITSNAYGNMARARFSADSAMESGLARMAYLLVDHPVSATLWEERGGVVGTVLYFKEAQNGEEVTRVAPLISGMEETTAEAWRKGNPALSLAHPDKPFEHPSNSVDINLPRSSTEASGWIGSRAGEARKVMRVPWMELRSPEGVLNGRYAYWIEDNSFKVLLNNTTGVERGFATLGIEAEEIPVQGVLQEVARRLRSNDDIDEAAHRIITFREAMPGGKLWDWNSLNSLPPLSGSSLQGVPLLGEQLRYYGTLFSESANLTSSGARRFDINALFTPEGNTTEVRLQIDRAVAAMQSQLPQFGQRFYRFTGDLNKADVSTEHQALYLEKLAVNMRDAMMPPALPPTVSWVAGAEPAPGRPVCGIEPLPGADWPGADFALLKGGLNSVRAIGKKNIPYLQEWACHVRLHKFDVTKGSHADFDFTMHYYLEFWNMSPFDIDTGRGDLGEHPFIRLYNLPGFDTGSGGTPIPAGGALEIPLENVVFKAGKATVITTAMQSEWNKTLLAQTPVDCIVSIEIPEAGRRFAGQTRKTVGPKSAPQYRVDLLSRSTVDSTDYETFLVLGNDAGLLDSVVGLALARGANSSPNAISLHNDKINITAENTVDGPNVEQYYVRGGSLHGNSKFSGSGKLAHTGDPRSTNEQLFLRIYEKDGGDEQSRYYNSKLDNPTSTGFNVPASSSLGRQNVEFANPLDWPDAFAWSSDGVDTPAYYPAGPLRSIGELGHVYDPARGLGPSGNILYSRGGGRTLAIGQPDPLWDGVDASKSGQWRAWRLADLFSTTSELVQPGRVNINGLLRDDGVAFRSLFYGYRYQEGAQGDLGLAGVALSDARLEKIVAAMKEHLVKNGPYFERGAWSEALGGETQAVYERGRKELFRRNVELTATRGSLFTLYAIGEAARETPGGAIVGGAVSRLKVTFRLVPVWNEEVRDGFDPTDPSSVAARFRPPDRYSVEIVQVER